MDKINEIYSQIVEKNNNKIRSKNIKHHKQLCDVHVNTVPITAIQYKRIHTSCMVWTHTPQQYVGPVGAPAIEYYYYIGNACQSLSASNSYIWAQVAPTP